ncbi:MAG: V-type ATP synthase subunit E [Candidatus Wallbacteria bacterium]|nr:V-type ATP synthase subunit E [Candidatus Wallbacteria bacterium]
MSLDRLETRIREEAESEAKSLLAEAELEAQRITGEFEKSVKQATQGIERRAQQAAETRKRNILTSARSEIRNRELSAMQELIDTVMSNSKTRLAGLPSDRYTKLLRRLILSTGIAGVSIRPGISDVKHFTRDFIQKLSAEGVKLTLDKPADFDHGFILRSGELEIDFSLDSILRCSRDELVVLIKQVLFSA